MKGVVGVGNGGGGAGSGITAEEQGRFGVAGGDAADQYPEGAFIFFMQLVVDMKKTFFRRDKNVIAVGDVDVLIVSGEDLVIQFGKINDPGVSTGLGLGDNAGQVADTQFPVADKPGIAIRIFFEVSAGE